MQPRSVRDPSAWIRSTFAFVDMAGFTALTEAQGDEDAADVAARFTEMARSALGPGDRLVKTMGDAVLVTSPQPNTAVDMVERLLTHAASEPDFPSLRAGLHHGDAIARDGDVFGAAVNLAARVAAEAHSGEVLGTKAIANAAHDLGIPVADLGAVLLKNVREAIQLYSLVLVVGVTDTPIDPVCRTPVDRRTAAGRLRFQGKEFWFCSLTCAAAFASNPEWHRDSVRPT
jgi:class 3 adenylate cyclase/YHS domain-containing protein